MPVKTINLILQIYIVCLRLRQSFTLQREKFLQPLSTSLGGRELNVSRGVAFLPFLKLAGLNPCDLCLNDSTQPWSHLFMASYLYNLEDSFMFLGANSATQQDLIRHQLAPDVFATNLLHCAAHLQQTSV